MERLLQLQKRAILGFTRFAGTLKYKLSFWVSPIHYSTTSFNEDVDLTCLEVNVFKTSQKNTAAHDTAAPIGPANQ